MTPLLLLLLAENIHLLVVVMLHIRRGQLVGRHPLVLSLPLVWHLVVVRGASVATYHREESGERGVTWRPLTTIHTLHIAGAGLVSLVLLLTAVVEAAIAPTISPVILLLV